MQKAAPPPENPAIPTAEPRQVWTDPQLREPFMSFASETAPVSSSPLSVLAGTALQMTSTADAGEYLTFRIAAEEYAIDILGVQEIRGHQRLTRIAHAPATIKGVIDLRGVIVPVVDLRLCLQVPSMAPDEETITIVLDLGHRVIGAVVDAVSDVLPLSGADIRPAPELRHNAGAKAVLGIACINEGGHPEARRMLIVLAIERLLADAGIGL